VFRVLLIIALCLQHEPLEDVIIPRDDAYFKSRTSAVVLVSTSTRNLQPMAAVENRVRGVGARQERHFALATTMLQLVLALFLHLLFIQVPGCRLVQLVPTYGTGRDLELPAAAPCRLLFFPRGVQSPRRNYFRAETYLGQPMHQPVKGMSTLLEKGDKAGLANPTHHDFRKETPTIDKSIPCGY